MYFKNTLFQIFIFILFFPGVVSAQERNRIIDNYRVANYLYRDSTNVFLIKEIQYTDGSRSYSIIPRSHLGEDNEVIQGKYPSTLIEWFNKEKRSVYSQKNKIEPVVFHNVGIIDTNSIVRKKTDKTIWWVLGTTAVVGGVTAMYFLQIKRILEELPIQPSTPK